jgi:hypothetical protein
LKGGAISRNNTACLSLGGSLGCREEGHQTPCRSAWVVEKPPKNRETAPATTSLSQPHTATAGQQGGEKQEQSDTQ